jgi:hypothetical protein
LRTENLHTAAHTAPAGVTRRQAIAGLTALGAAATGAGIAAARGDPTPPEPTDDAISLIVLSLITRALTDRVWNWSDETRSLLYYEMKTLHK